LISLVAGGAGFVGSHLCDRLMANGDDVICLDNLITGRCENIEALTSHPRFTFVSHDIIDDLPSLPRVDRIFHLASPASPRAYQLYPIETMRANSEGTRRLLELAARDGARFVYTSTSEVYGDPLQHPQREDYWGNVNPVGPRSMYDEAKRYGEALIVTYAEARSINTAIARIFNTYGPRMRPDDGRIISNFITQCLRGDALTVHGDGSQTRSFQYVDDLITGLILLAESTSRGPMNLGNPEEYTVLALAQLIRDLTQSRSSIVFEPLPTDDPQQRRPDIGLATRTLEWQPTVSVRDGLQRTIAYYRDNH
jgi:nucleoside-diphosphate-sugar epimerase